MMTTSEILHKVAVSVAKEMIEGECEVYRILNKEAETRWKETQSNG